MFSKCSDIDGEHIDSEGIEVEMVILTWMMRTIIWTTGHCIDIFDKNVHFGVWGNIGPLGTEHKVLSNTIQTSQELRMLSRLLSVY